MGLGEFLQVSGNSAHINQFARPMRGSFGRRTVVLIERK
jgi:hypothetical protein